MIRHALALAAAVLTLATAIGCQSAPRCQSQQPPAACGQYSAAPQPSAFAPVQMDVASPRGVDAPIAREARLQ